MENELKTLKDLNLGWEGYEPEDENIRKQLRQEAIKWVKNCLCRFRPKGHCVCCRKFILFFNITEEDLK